MYRQTKTIRLDEDGEAEITVIFHATGLTMTVTYPDGVSKEVVWTPQEGREIERMMQLAHGSAQNRYM